MASLLRNKHGNYIFYSLMALLVVGLGGFGIRNFSTGGGDTAVAHVGDEAVTAADYSQALRQEMQIASQQTGQQLTFAQAQQLGIDRGVLRQLFNAAALDDEARRFGLSVGDDQVLKRLMSFKGFQGVDGKFDRTAYRFQLEQQGTSEAAFEGKIRAETARSLLQGAVVNGIGAPATYVTTMTGWAAEQRSFTIAEILPSDLATPVAAPTETDLKAYYDAHPDQFTRPETRKLTTLSLAPEMLADTVTVDEETLKKAYEARRAEFNTPERRIVDRLVFPTEDEAKAARARIDAGTATFESIVKERGLTLKDVSLGEQSKDQLGAAGDAVFALAAPGVVGPIASDLGPALFSVDEILAGQTTTFEEAKAELTGEARLDRARRMIQDKTSAIEDALASGASLEDVAKEQGMKLEKIAFNSESEGGLAGYPEFRKAAEAVKQDDFPELVTLQDGGIFTLRLDGIEAPKLKPLAEVHDAVVEAWTKEETHKRLLARAAEVKAAADGGTSLAAQGLVTNAFDKMVRGATLADVPAEVGTEVFKIAKGATAIVDKDGRVIVVSLSDITPADFADDHVKALQNKIEAQATQGLSQDLFELYTQALQDSEGVQIDTAMINAVNSQILR